LLQQGVHALAEIGQSGWPFTSEQIAAELSFQLLDCPGQRGLRDVALNSSASEVECPRNGEEIPDLMHFHSKLRSSGW
jgi:hypothetical protein